MFIPVPSLNKGLAGEMWLDEQGLRMAGRQNLRLWHARPKGCFVLVGSTPQLFPHSPGGEIKRLVIPVISASAAATVHQMIGGHVA